MSPYTESSSNSRNSASLRFRLAAAITSCNFGVMSWTCGCSTLGEVTRVTGSECARRDSFENFWTRQATFRTLTSTSWRSLTRVQAMWSPLGAWSFRLGSTTPFSTPRALQLEPSLLWIVQVSPHHWPLPGWKARAPPRGFITIPFAARHSIWRPRYTDASYARMMSRPKMNSLVILVTNTKIFSGRRPKVPEQLLSRWGGLSQIPSAACRIGSVAFQAIGQPCRAWQVTYTPVSMVTRHGLSPTQPCVTRLGSAICFMTARGGGLNVYASIPSFPPTPPCFTPLCCFSVTILTSSVPASLGGLLSRF
jgi:hypothetical protein